MPARRSAHHSFIEQHGVPAGWEELRLRDLAKLVGGGTPDSSEPRFWDGDIPWLTPTEMTSIKGRFATTSERKITQAALESCACQLLPVGSLVLSTRGTIGNVVIAGVPLTCNQSCEALLPYEGIASDYLYYLLSYARPVLQRFGAGTTFPSVTRRDIRDIRFAVVRGSEQSAICTNLASVDDALTAAEGKLAAARRLKTALMQQLFTRGIPARETRFKQTAIGEVPQPWEVVRMQTVFASPPFNGVSPASRPNPPGTPILNVEAPQLYYSNAFCGAVNELVFRYGSRETDLSITCLRQTDETRLLLFGRIADEALARAALHRWLIRQTREHLIPRLAELSKKTGFRFRRTFIKRQKTRWASCSRHQSISLNTKLLFLPPELVDYVLIHELCHVAEMNHSRKFWSILAHHCPGYRPLDTRLREAWKLLPRWAF